MAALFELASVAAVGGERTQNASVDPASVTAGLAYVNRCLRGHRPFAIVTGSSRPMAVLIERATRACSVRADLHTVCVTAPAESVQVFLSACLAQLGFELFDVGLEDLHNLLVVFLRHEGARGRRTVVIVEGTERCGPRVLEFMQTVSRIRAGATPAITFVLSGTRDLHRVLDSRGMSTLRQFTRERFDLDRALAWVTPVPEVPRPGPSHLEVVKLPGPPVVMARRLLVMLDGCIVGRHDLPIGQLVIGRSAQCGLKLDSRYVSRRHAGLTVTDDAVTIADLRSTNATLVNGVAVTTQALEHGDIVAIGNFRLRFDCRPAAG